MVSSLDGIIAKKDNSVTWFETSHPYEHGIENTEEEAADCYVMGSRTYEHALELSRQYDWPYGDIPTIVLSQRKLPVERKSVEIFCGDIRLLVTERLKPSYKNVWVVGGAKLTKNFLIEEFADEIRVNILPIILGDGLPFFDHIGKEVVVALAGNTAFKNGMVELRYKVVKQTE